MQKLICSALLFLLLPTLATAQTNRQAIQYQAIARDKNQKPLAAADVSIEAKIFKNNAQVYTEKVDKKTSETGLFTLEIGRGNAADFQKIDWSSGDFELEISVSGAVNLTSRAPILSVPFAFRAANLESNGAAAGQVLKWDATAQKWLPAKDETGSGGGGGATALEDLSDVSLAGLSAGQVLKWDGSKWSPQNDIGGGTGDNWGNQTVQTSNIFSGNGTAGSPLDLASQNASNGQVLKWNGSAWSPSSDLTGGGGGTNFWVSSGMGIEYTGGDVLIKTPNLPKEVMALGTYNTAAGVVGGMQTMDDNGVPMVSLSNDDFHGNGAIYTFRNNGKLLTSIINDAQNLAGAFITYNQSETPTVRVISTDEDNGSIETRGPLNKETCNLNALAGFPNHGYISVSDETEEPLAGVFVDENKQGYIFGDVLATNLKNFRMPDPRNTEREIWYACVEGPEAAAYERGTAKLSNGRAFVPFSDHFAIVINPEKLTVQLTPQSAETFGLAVVEKTPTGFWVQELQKGTGNFSFDWEAKSVRRGYENYEVLRPKFEPRPAKTLASPAARPSFLKNR